MMRLATCLSLAAGLSLLAGCKDSSDSSAMRPTTSGSASSAAPADPSPMARTGDTSASADSTKKDTSARGNTATGDSATGMAGRMAKSDDSNQETGSAATTATGSATPKNVTGTLATASADEVSVDTANQPGLKLKVNASTTVLLDGKKASASQLQEGAQVRASYQMVGDQPTALRIEARSSTDSTKSKSGADPSMPGAPGKQ